MSEDALRVEIESLSSGGDGVARLADGRVVFVSGGVPGDRVLLRDLDERARFVRAEIDRVLEPSPDRVAPACSAFGRCGGCLWQHVAYPAQVEAKRRIVSDALSRIGGLTLDEALPIMASPSPYGYRARARWVECEGRLGYRERKGRGVVPVEACPVLLPAAESLLGDPSAVLGKKGGDAPSRQRPRRDREWVVTVGSEAGEERAIVVPVGSRRARRREADAPRSVFVEVAGERLRVAGESFVQANGLLWEALVEAVVSACHGSPPRDSSRPARFVELYAGVGFFTLPLARRGAEGVAFESSPPAVADLRANLAAAGLTAAIEVVSGVVEKRLDLADRFRSADWLFVDPPRAGLAAEVRQALAKSGPPRVVYLSCDPGTLARDVGELCRAGYALQSVQAFDLFPQTPHVETLVSLERESS